MEKPKNNISKLNLTPGTIKCAWDDDHFYITTIESGVETTNKLNPEMEDIVCEQLTIKRQPWGGVS